MLVGKFSGSTPHEKNKKKGKATRVEELVSTRGMSTGVGRESIVVDRKQVEIP